MRIIRPASGSVLACIFCTSTFVAGSKGEDIISGWYAKGIGHPLTGEVLFGIVDSTASVFSDPVASQTVAAKPFRLPDVCPSCNNGWMSRIEERAKPHLLPMMAGVNTTLTPEAQQDVAAWAQLKVVLWDYLQRPAHLPESIRHTFERDQPIRAMAVVLGNVASKSKMDIQFFRRIGTLNFNGGGTGVEVIRVTIRFDNLVLQVSHAPTGGVPVEVLRDICGPLVSIWPPRYGQESKSVQWPPPHTWLL